MQVAAEEECMIPGLQNAIICQQHLVVGKLSRHYLYFLKQKLQISTDLGNATFEFPCMKNMIFSPVASCIFS